MKIEDRKSSYLAIKKIETSNNDNINNLFRKMLWVALKEVKESLNTL